MDHDPLLASPSTSHPIPSNIHPQHQHQHHYHKRDRDRDSERDRESTDEILRMFVSEFLGTFVFLLVGLGATTSSVVTGAQSGIWQGAVCWGIAASLAIYVTR